jgi:hypothetical protein
MHSILSHQNKKCVPGFGGETLLEDFERRWKGSIKIGLWGEVGYENDWSSILMEFDPQVLFLQSVSTWFFVQDNH